MPLAVAALYWRRLTKAGAYASVLTMAGTWVWFFVQADFAQNRTYSFLGMLPVATVFPCSAVALVVVSLMTRPPSNETLARFFPTENSHNSKSGEAPAA